MQADPYQPQTDLALILKFGQEVGGAAAPGPADSSRRQLHRLRRVVRHLRGEPGGVNPGTLRGLVRQLAL